MTDKFLKAEWLCKGGPELNIGPHVHYRLALVEVGYSLADIRGTQELLCGLFDAFEGAPF